MASPKTIGTVACENCGSTAYVKKNKGGFPYYRCGNCDKEGREHSEEGARLFMKKVALRDISPEETGEKQEPAKSEKKPEATPVPKKRAPGSVAAFLLGE